MFGERIAHADLEAEGLQVIADEPVPSDIGEIGPTVDRIVHRVRFAKRVVGREQDIDLVLREAMTNAFVHRNGRTTAADGRIIVASGPRNALVVIFRDQSRGFDPSLVPRLRTDQTSRGSRDRNAYVIRTLMRNVSFRDGGREVRLRIV